MSAPTRERATPSQKLVVPRGPRATFPCMEPSSPPPDSEGDDEPLAVSFDDVQGPYRRRVIRASCAVAVAVLAILAAWRVASLPRPIQSHRSAPHAARLRRPRRPARAARAPLHRARATHLMTRRSEPPRKPSRSRESVIATNPAGRRPSLYVVVGPQRPHSESQVGQRQRTQFQYLGR